LFFSIACARRKQQPMPGKITVTSIRQIIFRKCPKVSGPLRMDKQPAASRVYVLSNVGGSVLKI
jgi:hypothetical protein